MNYTLYHILLYLYNTITIIVDAITTATLTTLFHLSDMVLPSTGFGKGEKRKEKRKMLEDLDMSTSMLYS